MIEAQEAATQEEGGFCGHRGFEDGVLRYTEDGAAYLDVKDRVVWVRGYEMGSPVVSTNDDFVTIGDQQGGNICIYDQNRTQG